MDMMHSLTTCDSYEPARTPFAPASNCALAPRDVHWKMILELVITWPDTARMDYFYSAQVPIT